MTIVSSVLLIFSEKTLFPEKLGDMELKLHKEGDVAMREIQNSHSAKDNINPNQAHKARYRSGAGNRATISVTVAETEKRAGGGEYHYYYSKNDLVIWIAVNNESREYRSRLIDEAIKKIGE